MLQLAIGAGVVFGLLALFSGSGRRGATLQIGPRKDDGAAAPRLRMPTMAPPAFLPGGAQVGPSNSAPDGTAHHTDMPYGGVRPAAVPTTQGGPAAAIKAPRMPPQAALDPTGRLPLYQLDSAFTINLPSVDENWQGAAGPPYVAHATIAELRWSPPGEPAMNTLESEAKDGTYIYTLRLAEYKAPKNVWTGSEGKIRAALASGVFKAAGRAVVGYNVTDAVRALADLRWFLSRNGLQIFAQDMDTGRGGEYRVYLRVPRSGGVVRGRELTAKQAFTLGNIIARRFKDDYAHDITVDWEQA